MSDIEIVPYTDDRADEVAVLLNLGLGPKVIGVRDADYWRWKHEQNPFGRSLMLLAEEDRRIVGIRAFMRWQFNLDGEVIEAAKPVDSVTHPDYQRRGIFSRLTLAACELATDQGIQLLFNTPNDNSRPGYLKLGWRVVGDLNVYGKLVRLVPATMHALAWKLRFRKTPTRESFFRREPRTAASVLNDSRLESLLADRQTGHCQLETLQSIDFLRWRYVQHPHIEYFAETTENSGCLGAVLFYRLNTRSGMREIMIDDAIVRGGVGDSVVGGLLSQLQAVTRGDYWVANLNKESPLHPVFRSWGFMRVPNKRITLTAKPLQNQFHVPDVNHWSLCFGDIEGL